MLACFCFNKSVFQQIIKEMIRLGVMLYSPTLLWLMVQCKQFFANVMLIENAVWKTTQARLCSRRGLSVVSVAICQICLFSMNTSFL